MQEGYKLLEHTGDIGIEVHGRTLPQLFRTAARALIEQMVRPARISSDRSLQIEVRGEDAADLLKNWLGEVLYEFMGNGMILSRFKVAEISMSDPSCRPYMKATAACRRFNPRRDRLKTEIKAVTYHQLKVIQSRRGWTARVILDL